VVTPKYDIVHYKLRQGYVGGAVYAFNWTFGLIDAGINDQKISTSPE
jgi:hypothetical protein